MVVTLKREKFVSLAERRTANALKAIRTIGKLSNKVNYDYDDKDVKKIVLALSKEVDALKRKFSDTGSKNEIEFKL